MHYTRAAGEAILASRANAGSAPTDAGLEGVVLILGTLAVLVALALSCRPKGVQERRRR
jgi:hypothetical protein